MAYIVANQKQFKPNNIYTPKIPYPSLISIKLLNN